MNAILEPWSWNESLTYFWPILVEGAVVSVALGLIGCFLVVRGLGLLGDALSHSVLPGIVIGFLISATWGSGSLQSPWILIGATLVGLGASVLIETVHRQSRVKEDASLGIVFTTLFATGVVMINLLAGQTDLDPGCVLYGNIEYMVLDPQNIWPMAVVLCVIVVLLVVFYRQLLVSTFDPALAISLGIPAVFIHYATMGVLSLTIVSSFEAVGAILVVALLILPGTTARLWTDRMPRMLWLSAGHGVLSTCIGYWLSHEAVLNTSASGAICLAGFGLFLLSWLLSPRHGWLTQQWVRHRLRRLIHMENLLRTIQEISPSGQPVSLEDLRREMNLSRDTLMRHVRRAVAAGHVQQADGQICLTEKGRDHSQHLVRAHELWERFLQTQVGLPADHVHDAAEWIEHHLTPEKIKRLEQILDGQPQSGA